MYFKIITILALLITLLSCSDDLPSPNQVSDEQSISEFVYQPGMQRAIFTSEEELNDILNQLKRDPSVTSRASVISELNFTNSDSLFISLYEPDKQKVYQSLSAQQIQEIESEDLEYEPSDSVIADINFAMLLNAEREIQMRDSVYKFVENGVIAVKYDNVVELSNAVEKTKNIKVTNETQDKTISLGNGANFTPRLYLQTEQDNNSDIDYPCNGEGFGGGGSNSNNVERFGNGALCLGPDLTIPLSDIMDVDYASKGNGGWFQKFASGFFGRNVVAQRKFEDGTKLVLSFYDQDYLICHKIGTKLKFQKKKFFIWWNKKTEEMAHGWEMISVCYNHPRPIMVEFKKQFGNNAVPAYRLHNFPFQDEDEVLLYLPFNDFEITNKHVNQAFQAGLLKAYHQAIDEVKKLFNNDPSNAGLWLINQNQSYSYVGPHIIRRTNVRSLDSKILDATLSGSFEIGCKIKGNRLSSFNFNIKSDGISLYTGIVFGAIKHNGKWLAARITKAD